METGESGERERIIRGGPFGLDEGYVKQEHFLPRKYNIEYRKMLRHRYYTQWNRHVKEFHGRFLEMRRKEQLQERLKQMRHVSWILKRFPDTDEKAIKEITIDFAPTQLTNLIGSSNKNSVVET